MPIQNINRRTLLKSAGAAIATPIMLRGNAYAAASTFKIGIVAPLTGPLAGFGEAQERLNKLIQGRASMKASVDAGAEIADALAGLVRELKKHRVD